MMVSTAMIKEYEPGEGLNVFFKPKSIAVVGASNRRGSIGYTIAYNLINTYNGKIYPINPKYDEIIGLKAYPSISSLPEAPDLVVITVKAELVPDIAEEAGKKGVKGIIVVAGGFAEAGEEGKILEDKLVSIVKKYRMRLIGPNCIGVYDASTGVDTFFISHDRLRRPPKGKIAVISQSGAFLTTFMDFIATEHVGIGKAVNFGNKADVDEVDLIAYLSKQPEIDTIMVYIEDVKPGRGQEFLKVAIEARETYGKRIVLLKGGRSQSGQRAAQSHTAALAGDYHVLSAALKQAGVIEVSTPLEFLDAAKALSMSMPAKGNEVLVLTHAGGPGVITTDLLETNGLVVPKLPDLLIEELKEKFPRRVAKSNPIDLTGDATVEDYEKALDILLKHDPADIYLVIAYIQPPTISNDLARVLEKAVSRINKPLIVLAGGSPEGDMLRKELDAKGIPSYNLPERVVFAAKAVVKSGKTLCQKSWTPIKYRKECKHIRKMREDKALELARRHGIPVPEYCMATSLEETKACFNKLRKPLVAKIVAEKLVHKSDIGGVKLGITSLDKALEAYIKLEKLGSPYGFKGVLFQEQAGKGLEVFVGGRIDPVFGPVVLFGAGGTLVELYKDISMRIAPLNLCEALNMIKETKISKLIEGYRGYKGDINAVLEILVKVSDILIKENVWEMDINPLIIEPDRTLAVDVRINYCEE